MKINSVLDLFTDNVIMYPRIKENNFYRIHNEEFEIIQTLSDKPKSCIISNSKFTLSVYITKYRKDYSELCILFDKFKQLLGFPSTGCAIVEIEGSAYLVHLKRDNDVFVPRNEELGYMRQKFLCTPSDFYISRNDRLYSIERSCGNDKVDERKIRKKYNNDIENCLSGHRRNGYRTRIRIDDLLEQDYRQGKYRISEIHISKFMSML